MKNTKKLSKLVALTVLLGGVTCGSSAWAENPVNITISSEGVSPNTYVGSHSYTGYIWGVGGNGSTQNIGSNVNSIVTSGDLTDECYGIYAEDGDSVSATSVSGGINIKSSYKVIGVYLYSGGQVNISGMGNITAESTGSNTYGISANNKNTVSPDPTFFVSFAETAGIIKAYYNSDLHYGYGIAFGYDSICTGTSEVKNVKTIEVGANPDVAAAKTYKNYGIYAHGGKNTVTFAGGTASSIVVRSGTVYGGFQYGIDLDGGTNTITGPGKIEMTGCSSSYGIYIQDEGTNKVEFAGTGSSITVNSTGGEVYGIGFGWDEGSCYATGTTEISKLGSITVETTSAKKYKNAYGIFADNRNVAGAATFSVSFATGDNDGKIKVYSEKGDNYGIYFDNNCTGTSEVKNVKTIEVGYRNNAGTEEVASEDAYGIYLYGGTNNNVQFVGAGGSITVKSQGDDGEATGICTGGANSTISNVNKVIVAGIGAADANGVYAYASGESNSITFVGDDSSVIVTSETGDAEGMTLYCDGITVSGLKKISATGAEAKGLTAAYGCNVTFTGADSSITAKSTGSDGDYNSYGIYLDYGTSVAISNLGSITATTKCKDNNAYGIYIKEYEKDCEYEISFTGGSVIKQAITATVSTPGGTGKAYSIYATTSGRSDKGETDSCSTTVNFEKTILSGKIYNKAATTGAGTETTELTLNFKYGSIWVPVDGDVEGDVNVNVKNKATIDTGDNGTTDSINLGNGTLTFENGSKIKIDMVVTATALTIDNFTVSKATGVVTLADVEINDEAATTAFVEKSVYLITGDCSGITNYTLGTGLNEITTENYKYTISKFQDTNGLGLKITMSGMGIAYEISGGSSKELYEFKADQKLTQKLGTLNNTNRASFTMDGKGYTLDANGQEGLTIESLEKSAKNIMTVKNITIKGFETFATNSGSLTLDGGDGATGAITFTGTTGTADVINTSTGVLNVNGIVTFDKGIDNSNIVNITKDGTILKGVEIKGAGTLFFKGNGEIDFSKISNKMDIAAGKTVTLGSSVEKTTEVNSESIEIDEGGELEIKSTGTGKVVMGDKVKITGRGNSKFRVKAGSFLQYKNRTPKSIKAAAGKVLDIFIEKNSTFDPCVSVFAENVNVNVAEEGTLVLTPGTLYANIKQEGDSLLKVSASDVAGATLLAGVDKASQLDVAEGTLTIEGAEKWGYYKLVSGEAVNDGTLKLDDLWYVDETLAGQGFESEYDVNNGVVTLEFRNIPLAVEANTSALAGVQQGAISMVGQIADAIDDNLGLLARPAQEGKYDKSIWATYINTKDTVDGMSIWRGKGDNTAKYHGVTVGGDFYTSEKAIAGVALTYVTGDVHSNSIDTVINNKTKYYGISLYNRVTNGNNALTYDIGYTHGKNEITENSYQTVTADAKTKSYTVGVKFERAYNFKHSSLVPFASLRYLRVNSNDYTNSNGFNMDIDDQNILQPKLGLTWTGDFKMGEKGWSFKPVAEVGYLWNMCDREADGTFRTVNRTYNIEYDTADKGGIYGKAGLNFQNKNFTGGVSYRYAKGSSTKSNKWNVNVAWSF